MSLLPTYWGEPIWKTMYIIAYTFPENASSEFKIHVCDIYEKLSFVLPCEECCIHYKAFLHEHPVEHAVKSRGDLLKWVNDLQNSINTKTKKPQTNLHTTIMEMDSFNRSKITVPITKETPINKRVGAISYGIRRPLGKPPRFNKKACSNCN